MRQPPIAVPRYLASSLAACALSMLASCAAGMGQTRTALDATPEPLVVGEFTDDYGSHYTITASEWRHGSRNRYHILKWNAAGQYLIARNDSSNAGEAGLFTRIDWLVLPGMEPWEWAYCYSAYQAPSAAAAERVASANRLTPRTGCQGHWFTRMRSSSR